MDTTHGSVAAWVTLATVVIGFLYQGWRAERQRKWDVEDRAILARKVQDEAAGVAKKMDLAAVKVIEEAHTVIASVESNAAKAADDRAQIIDAIAANTAMTEAARDGADRAYQEANSVNVKIEKLNVQTNALQKEQADQKDEQHEERKAELAELKAERAAGRS